MAERGAIPDVPRARRRALRALRSLFTPLLPDDYLELINPLWSTRELRGRIERIERETDDTVTIVIRPGYRWRGHLAGQYLRIGVVVDGIHHWRAYSLTSPPDRPDGCISITPKLVESGKVSPHFVRDARPGDIVRLGGVEGTFTLPRPVPAKLLFVSAGSGITPIISMLREIDRAGPGETGGVRGRDIVHLHCSRTREGIAFGGELERFDAGSPRFKLHLQITGEEGRIGPGDLDRICPDWRERDAFVSGPGEMLDAFSLHWAEHGEPDRLKMERFQPVIGGDPGDAVGGRVSFIRSGIEAQCDGGTPILAAAEQAGLELKHGCRMGICRTCIGRLDSGQLRDLRTGEVHGTKGEMVRICVNAPEGPVELNL